MRDGPDLGALLQSSSIGMLRMRPDGRITDVNAALAEMLGHERKDIGGRDVNELLHPDDRVDWDRGLGHATDELGTIELRLRARLGGYVSALVSPMLRRGADGTVQEIVAQVVDISQQRFDLALLQGRSRVLELVGSGEPLDVILTTLIEIAENLRPEMLGSVLVLERGSNRVERSLGPSLPAFYNDALRGAVAQQGNGSCGEAIATGRRVVVEDVTTHPLWATHRELAARAKLRACWSQPIVTSAGEVVGSFGMYYRSPRAPTLGDLQLIEACAQVAAVAIARERADLALRESEARLRQAMKLEAVGQLAGGVAHDFNNLLTAIVCGGELLQRSVDPGAEEAAVVDDILQAAARGTELVRQLLSFARQRKSVEAPVDIGAVVRVVASLLQRIIDKAIVVEVDVEEGAVVLGDEGELQSAILNLGLNARDAMPSGGRLRLAAHVVTDDDGERWIEVVVADTGVGIDPEVREHIFEPFFTTKEPGHGTGLGLAAVYGCVVGHRGRIDVESMPGAGTTFRVRLPPHAGTVRARASASPAPIAGAGHVLVIEDEELVRAFAVRALSSLGYTVTPCEDGIAGVALFRERHRDVDLVLLDLVMPRQSGAVTLTKLREIDPRVPVVVTSGFHHELEVSGLLARGAAAYLAKPFRLEDLSAVVAAHIDRDRT